MILLQLVPRSSPAYSLGWGSCARDHAAVGRGGPVIPPLGGAALTLTGLRCWACLPAGRIHARGADSGYQRGTEFIQLAVIRTMWPAGRLRRLCEALQDPELVARFQRFCGVLPAAEKPVLEASLPNGGCIGGEPEVLRHRDPHSNRLSSGTPPEEGSEVRQRRNSLTGESGQRCVIRNRLLYYLLGFGTELGNELFYISFFPFWIWNVDAFVGRRLIVIWVWVMYLGQCTKDLIRQPRPASPPVIKLEAFYNSEYSMPSTHAMSGTAIPLSLLLLTCGRFQFPFMLGLLLAVVWCSLVCASRIYMGMHSILDVIAGFFYAILIMVVFHPALEIIDNFNLTYKYAPLIIISLHLAMGIFSFTLDTWSTSRGDTAQILGSGAGIACGSHVNYLLGLMVDPSPDKLPFNPLPITVTLFGKALLKFLIGVVLLLLIRGLMKKVTIPLACKIFRIPCDDVRKARQHMEVELPYRYITYGMVGFGVMFIVPCLFNLIGL